ncbi:MAG: hypothetical protein KDI75_03980 [Xanthomonadales bacterium]|nr:hypothetical protein [Xanthomonadales bacterium]
MSINDTDYDPDDNFANSAEGGGAVDDEAALEEHIWHLLLLINPGDEESALQQFGEWQERMQESSEDDDETLPVLRDVIDWKSGFRVPLDEPDVLMDALGELAARVGVHIDWDIDDDEDAADSADSASLIAQAHDRLRQDGYSLWTWSPRGESDEEIVSGWITPRFEDQPLRVLCETLGVELRAGSTWG